ncbi:hypothetical protein Ancab_021893 [Ancistrocladus abbreviatus]
MENFLNALESQKQLYESQVEQLHQLVVTQCRLTGVNPLAEEMVREFFATQRAKVTEAVLLSKEMAIKSLANKEKQDDAPAGSDSIMPKAPAPLSSPAPSSAEHIVSCLKPEDIEGLDEPKKTFMNTIFDLMREAKTFSGQEALMKEILKMKKTSVLCWFVTNGGLVILAAWLNEAIEEEQTSFLSVAVEVLSHLPMHKVLPAHMSDILMPVSKLRLYLQEPGTVLADRARRLMLRWSRVLGKCDASKRPRRVASSSDAPKETDQKRTIAEIVHDESRESEVDVSKDDIAPSDGSAEDTRAINSAVDFRNVQAEQPGKLPAESSDDSNRKAHLGFRILELLLSFETKERRKVLLVEQPGQKAVGKRQQVPKAASASQGRPITADEILKAKLRAQVLQSKHGKAGSSSDDSQKKKSENQKRPFSLLAGDLLSASQTYLRPKPGAQKKTVLLPLPPTSSEKSESPDNKKRDSELKIQIQWRTPAEIRINPDWRVGTGMGSKEVAVQRSRTSWEKATVYPTAQDVPPNPKEPWDVEMDYDDSLTVEIPTGQLPEAATSKATSPPTSSLPGSSSTPPHPDLDLLVVHLKNPDLAFALTSGQASGLSSEETTKLVDMIKSSGGAWGLGPPAGITENRRVEVSLPSTMPVRPFPMPPPSQISLPSPPPPSNPALVRDMYLSGSRVEATNHPFSWQSPAAFIATTGIVALNQNMRQGTTSVQPKPLPQNVITHQQPTVPSSADRPYATLPSPSFTRSSAPSAAPQVSPAMLQITPPQNSTPQNPAGMVSTRSIPRPTVSISPQTTPTLQPHLWSQHQQPQSFLLEPVRYPQHSNRPIMNPSPVTQSWQARQGLPSQPYAQGNHQHNYNRVVGATGLHPSLPGSSWQRSSTDFELWTPDNSSRERYWEQMQGQGWNHPEQRRNFRRGHGPRDWSRHQNSGGTRGGHQHGRQ